jgi:hypothetical protein
MDPAERAFHDTFKPRWAADGTCIVATSHLRKDLIGSLAETDILALNRINVFAAKGFCEVSSE